jgi:hypothetical protein
VRLRAILLRQKDLFAPITVARSRRFEEILAKASAEKIQEGLAESFG